MHRKQPRVRSALAQLLEVRCSIYSVGNSDKQDLADIGRFSDDDASQRRRRRNVVVGLVSRKKIGDTFFRIFEFSFQESCWNQNSLIVLLIEHDWSYFSLDEFNLS